MSSDGVPRRPLADFPSRRDYEMDAWPRIEALLVAALDLPPDARDPFLDAECQDDPALRAHVGALVVASVQSGPVDVPAASLAGWLADLEPGADPPRLDAGTRLGPYIIEAQLGAGGMGQVYRARDTRLNRDVAIKIVAPHLQQHRASRKRLEREARVIASLSHPNVVAVYDIGDHDGLLYLVTELLTGRTLREMLAAGALGEQPIIDIATQVARGLSAAHARQIVHRDLKPENLFVTNDGVVKILDFGLAKPRPHERERQPDTVTSPHAVLGTIGYMSPEQLTGDDVDGRSDLFSLGAVLYEAATGTPAFVGGSRSEIAAAILSSSLPVAFPPGISPALAQTIKRCLGRLPADRYQSAADFGFTLQLLGSGSTVRHDGVGSTDRAPVPSRRTLAAALSIAGLIGAALVATWILTPSSRIEERPITFVLHAPPGAVFGRVTMAPRPAVSPDGRRLAFLAETGSQSTLWVQTLGETQARPLTRSDVNGAFPFWSPDSEFVGFGSRQRLFKVAVSGARAPQELCTCDARWGGAWSRDGTIVFAGETGVFRIPPQGGRPVQVTRLDAKRGEFGHRFPVLLPDGRHFLYVALSTDERERGVYLGALDDPAIKRRLLADDSNVAYDTGADGRTYLFFVRDRVLLMQPFDVARASLQSDPIVVAGPVVPGEGGRYAPFGVGGRSLVHRSRSRIRKPLIWVSRNGVPGSSVGPPDANFRYPVLSQDGTKLAVSIADAETDKLDVWLIDLLRQTSDRLTRDAVGAFFPQWTPDGRRVFFASSRDRRWTIYSRSILEGGEAPLFGADSAPGGYPTHVSRDGQWLIAFCPGVVCNGYEGWLWRLPLSADGRSAALVKGRQGRLSPDGRWLAYAADDTGVSEVYVTSFPEPGQRWRVSTRGGHDPQWRQDARELYYVAHDDTLTAVPVSGGRTFGIGQPQPLFRVLTEPSDSGLLGSTYAPAANGQRFLVSVQDSSPRPVTDEVLLQVTINWGPPAR
jgi:Tol biopolymer transport system component